MVMTMTMPTKKQEIDVRQADHDDGDRRDDHVAEK